MLSQIRIFRQCFCEDVFWSWRIKDHPDKCSLFVASDCVCSYMRTAGLISLSCGLLLTSSSSILQSVCMCVCTRACANVCFGISGSPPASKLFIIRLCVLLLYHLPRVCVCVCTCCDLTRCGFSGCSSLVATLCLSFPFITCHLPSSCVVVFACVCMSRRVCVCVCVWCYSSGPCV